MAMAVKSIFFAWLLLLLVVVGAMPDTYERVKEVEGLDEHAVPDPDRIADMVHESIINSTERRKLGASCGTGNPIDDCWRCDPNWFYNRKRLADCGIGFGRGAIGGRNGRFYVVTDSSDNDAVNPRPGTLRHAVLKNEPLWIVFKSDMMITLKQELIMNSFKTIDGRGANVHIRGGGCITIQDISHVIIHGLHIHDCKPSGHALVRSSPSHYGWRGMADGDAITIFASSHIWVDHNSLSNCADGLVDVVAGSTAITISNNHFTKHNEVMMLGHSDSYYLDKRMQVTVAFNHFGTGLNQRIPRCRHGYFHVVNNDYTHWRMYAIGGSANPTIFSQGNRFLASNNPRTKEVTKRVNSNKSQWKNWNWRSEGDMFLNGAYFTPSGASSSRYYTKASSLRAKTASMVGRMTSGAGVLGCRKGRRC
ncbi:Pectate lyase [Heracleum sosnowskyi]|uniref:Pectate lyase n=1 Tax=Heracleum sosnowskyi TaxID=360622 RepID=A0AAD8N5D9_9APIA|nr:Pectate lyase [Heracleum sosnowskyi]